MSLIRGLLDDFRKYLGYLTVTYGYRITIHHVENMSGKSWTQLLAYNFHQCSLCRVIKSSFTCWRHCIDRQHKVRSKAEVAPFIGTCYAGVTEAVFPIWDIHEYCVGFLCVSGYTVDPKESLNRASATAKKYGLPMEEILEAVEELDDHLPELNTLAIQIAPLQTLLRMIFYFNSITENDLELANPREELYYKILNYTNSSFRNPGFSLNEVCNYFSISYSHASHLFSEFNDVTFSLYVRNMRIEAAKHYLEHTTLPIAFTSAECGFSDSNYFSSVFRKVTGMSPTEYRNKFA